MALVLSRDTSCCNRIASIDEQPSRPVYKRASVTAKTSIGYDLLPTGTAKPSSISMKRLSPFLRLPPEVRMTIYRHLIPPAAKATIYTDTFFKNNYRRRLAAERHLEIYEQEQAQASKCKRDFNGRPYEHPQPFANPLALLRINRLVYIEALSVLYSEHEFHFVGSSFLPVFDFFRKLSPDAKGMVRQVKLTMLIEQRNMKVEQWERFCKVIHEWLPGLNVLSADGWTWL